MKGYKKYKCTDCNPCDGEPCYCEVPPPYPPKNCIIDDIGKVAWEECANNAHSNERTEEDG